MMNKQTRPTEIRSLRRLLTHWAQEGQVVSISCEVDPDQEISAITDIECKKPGGGRNLLFIAVRGAALSLATNVFGSPQRAQALWGDKAVGKLAEKLKMALNQTPGINCSERLETLLNTFRNRKDCLGQLRIPSARLNLELVPAIKSWPGDGGFYLTMGLTSMRDPDTGAINWGIYRMQRLDQSSVAVHFLTHSCGAEILRKAKERNQDLPIAVSFGGEPALLTAAALPLPAHVDEAAFVAFLTEKSPPLGRAPETGLPVLNDAEFVIEGVIRPCDQALEGPFGNHTGFYPPAAPAPVMQVRALYCYPDAICPATVVGPPPMENIQLIKANEALILALLQVDYPQILNLSYLVEGVFHGCAVVAVDKAEQAPLELAKRLWGMGPLQHSRLLVLVDGNEDLDVDGKTLLWRILNQVDPEHDVIVSQARMGVDATRKKDWERVEHDPEILNKVCERWRDYGL